MQTDQNENNHEIIFAYKINEEELGMLYFNIDSFKSNSSLTIFRTPASDQFKEILKSCVNLSFESFTKNDFILIPCINKDDHRLIDTNGCVVFYSHTDEIDKLILDHDQNLVHIVFESINELLSAKVGEEETPIKTKLN